MNMDDLIRKYVNNNVGVAWDVLWEYLKCERQAFSKLNVNRKRIVTKVLDVYLRDFGMNRAGNMNDADSNTLAAELDTDESNAAIRFFETLSLKQTLTQPDLENFDNHLSPVGESLENSGYSNTQIMISKVLLGLTGNVPAYDRYFTKFLMDQGITKTLNSRSYNELISWLSKYRRIERLRLCGNIHHPTTRLSAGFNVPDMRLLDIVGWQYGWTQLKDKKH